MFSIEVEVGNHLLSSFFVKTLRAAPPRISLYTVESFNRCRMVCSKSGDRTVVPAILNGHTQEELTLHWAF
jgi:hypothetical protein